MHMHIHMRVYFCSFALDALTSSIHEPANGHIHEHFQAYIHTAVAQTPEDGGKPLLGKVLTVIQRTRYVCIHTRIHTHKYILSKMQCVMQGPRSGCMCADECIRTHTQTYLYIFIQTEKSFLGNIVGCSRK
jgi:hypothetical protein